MLHANSTLRLRADTLAHLRRVYAPILAATLLSFSAISSFSASTKAPEPPRQTRASSDMKPATTPVTSTRAHTAAGGRIVMVTRRPIDLTALPETAFGD